MSKRSTLSPKKFAKLALAALRHPISTWQCLASNDVTPDQDQSIILAAEWLLRAQECAPDGEGYSRSYSLINGWDRCYIETTGYIIPTLFDVSEYSKDDKFRNSALKAAEWLLFVQNDDGSFTDIDEYKPQVFDTGQVLLGLNRTFLETKDERYLHAANAAGRWLVEIMEPDGSWVRHAYNERSHTYYTRVAAALIEVGQISGVDEYIQAGVKNLEWTVSQRQPNGYYMRSDFRVGEPALLHTLVYVLEGFSIAFELTGDQRWANELRIGAEALSGAEKRGAIPHSQYHPDWSIANSEYCVTGLAQYAGICFAAAKHGLDTKFYDQGLMALHFLSSWQQTRGKEIIGGLQSSIPIWGYYGGMEFYNWNAKFYLDALLKSKSFDQ